MYNCEVLIQGFGFVFIIYCYTAVCTSCRFSKLFGLSFLKKFFVILYANYQCCSADIPVIVSMPPCSDFSINRRKGIFRPNKIHF